MRELFFRFRRNGFIVLKNVITPEQLNSFRRTLGVTPAKMRLPKATHHSDWNLPFARKITQQKFTNQIEKLTALQTAIKSITETEHNELNHLTYFSGKTQEGRFQKWHKDTEVAQAQFPTEQPFRSSHLKFYSPLFLDTSLRLVPGSHYRQPSWPELEYAQQFEKLPRWEALAKARAIDPTSPGGMPNSIRVRMQAGDMVIFHRNIWCSTVLQPLSTHCTLQGNFASSEERVVQHFQPSVQEVSC